MNKPQIDVSIIIVNYKTSHLIINCVKSLFHQTKGIDYEIFIIDNNSEKDFESAISTQIGRHYNIHYISLPENIGFGRANNEALPYAKGRNILFLNPDTIILNNAIKILSDFLDTNLDAGACGGNLYGESLQPAFSFRRFLPGIFWDFNEMLHHIPFKIRYGKDEYFNSTQSPYEVGFISGADLMVKYDVLDKTGGFSKDFFMYYEETDLCARIAKNGWKIYSVPDAKIQHLDGKSFQQNSNATTTLDPNRIKLMEEGRHLYLKKNTHKTERYITNVLYWFFLKSRSILTPKYKKEQYKLYLKYFKEAWH